MWQLVHRGMQLDQLQRIFAQVAGGLGYLHEYGIVHGDLNASNLMVLPSGETKILDFDLAALGVLVPGTPAYMSPEQQAGRPLDARCDIFSLAAVMKFAVGEYTPSDLPPAPEIVSPRRQPPGWDDPLVRLAWTDLIAKSYGRRSLASLSIGRRNAPGNASLPLPSRSAHLSALMPAAAAGTTSGDRRRLVSHRSRVGVRRSSQSVL